MGLGGKRDGRRQVMIALDSRPPIVESDPGKTVLLCACGCQQFVSTLVLNL